MPTDAQLEAWFPYLFGFNVLWIVGIFAFGIIRRIQSGEPLFPRKPDRAAFYESGASGRNLRSVVSRLGGAGNCLIVSIVDGRLTTDLGFPFNIFPIDVVYGIRIDIRLPEIHAIERRHRLFVGEVVVIRWGSDEGYELKVRDHHQLIRALEPAGRLQVKVV